MRAAAGGLARPAAGGEAVARRAVFRWGWRLCRREWRQQLLVFGLLTVAVAAMVTGSAVATAAPGQPGEATFGSATAMITLPGSDPRLAAGIAASTTPDDAVRWRRGLAVYRAGATYC